MEEEKASQSLYEQVENVDQRNSMDKGESPELANRKTTKPESKIHRIMEKSVKMSPKSSFELSKDLVHSPRHVESVATPKPIDLKYLMDQEIVSVE